MPLSSLSSFDTITVERTHHLTGTPPRVDNLSAGANARSPAVTIDYDPVGDIYTIIGEGVVATFTPADRLAGGGYIDHYRTASDELRVYNNVRSGADQDAGPIQLSYLSFAAWTHSDPTGEVRQSHLLFGYPTGSADMPRTGSASFETMVTGNVLSVPESSLTDITGTATFAANFGAGTVDTQLALTTMAGADMGTYSGTGSISGDQFSGSFSSNAVFFEQGEFAGGFFGPSAAEMGYEFFLRHYNPDPYAGASLNRVDDWIIGTVVGVKN